jgi:probable phosphoglycerate mutase
VSHADPIKLALAHYLGLPLDLFQRLVIDPASISILLLDDFAARVARLNDTRAGELKPAG